MRSFRSPGIGGSARRTVRGSHVGEVAHQLRTRFTVARGHTELIRDLYADEETAQTAELIVEELDRLFQLADRLLVVAATGRADLLQRSPVVLGDLVRDGVARWWPKAARTWTASVNADGSLVGDGERLAAVLDALIENAVEVTDEGDRVMVAGEADGDTAVILVHDSGIGIESDQLDEIFEPFTWSEGSRTSRPRAGLGLAFVRTVVEAHGGDVRVQSEVGKGTTFELRLPGYKAGLPADR